ncbi:energy transducer TonB [Pontibacter toksunensis]|uniref:Energy transducer TonB n=1 Tax=Pontibacter toksunensis TaxID=1332631 RepID=A0ABW6BZF9_9BACT
MKKLILTRTTLIASLFACIFATAACSTEEEPTIVVQEKETASVEKTDTSKAYTYAEQIPVYKDSEAALLTFLGSNIKYPEAAEKAGVEGITVMSFVVETDGTITDIEIVKSLSPETDQEAVRAVKLTSGSWIPGKNNGKDIRFRYTLPVRYTLD